MRRRILVWAILLASLCGCGVGEYEKQIDRQRQRIQEFDELNRLLEDPLEMPTIQAAFTKAETPAWPFELFLRLPKGYGTTLKEKEKLPYNAPFPCFRYVGPDPNTSIFIAAGLIAKSKETEKGAETTPERFRFLVKQGLEAYYAKATAVKLLFPDKVTPQLVEVKRFASNSALEGKLHFDLVSYFDVHNKLAKENVAFQAYFHRDNDRQICIVAHRPIATMNDPTFKKSLEACLGSLDVSSDAGIRRAHFLRAKRRGPS